MAKSNRQVRYLSQAIQLEESANPSIIRSTVLTIGAGIVAFIGWAALTSIHEIAHTPGEIIPQGQPQVVQHLEGGLVREISVTDSQLVQKGDVLITLDGTGAREDLERAESKQISLNMQEERLRSFIENREPDFSSFSNFMAKAAIADQQSFYDGMVMARSEERKIVEEQIKQKHQMIQTLNADLKTAKENHDIAEDLLKQREVLYKKGYVSKVKYLETQQSVNQAVGEISKFKSRLESAQAEISEFDNRLKSLDAGQRDQVHERLDQLLADKTQNAELVSKLRDRVGRLTIVAPVRGLVKGMEVNTVGAVVQPGQTLMEIVPVDEELIVQVKIPPQHIGHVKPGQDVKVKFSSFDFSRYGFVTGKLSRISATTFSGENGERYYQGQIDLDRNYIGENSDNTVVPGMTVMADIITGRKTILEYLLKPIRTSVKTAFTER